jgi:membrane-associated protease RseP (regulator of RpoE activity)
LPAPVRTRPRYVIHAGLFLLTVVTTVAAGMLWEGLDPLKQPALFYRGLPYAGTLLTILFCHEMGHYLTARYYGMDVTLPYFLPAPPVPFILGTFGAFIRMKSPPQHRRALLYVGAAGPIAGFCVALPAMIYAYTTSTVTPIPTEGTGLYFGEPLLLQLIGRLVIGPLPEGAVLTLNSVGLAAWFGLLVTMFNLLPIGQLDGGHIVYALLGRATRYLSWLLIGVLLVLGWYFWPGWYFWALVGWLTGRRHPTILDQHAPLTRRSQVIAGLALVIFIACFMPVPVDIVGF